MTNNNFYLILLSIVIVYAAAYDDDVPTVHESWIFAMVGFGFIGSAVLIFLIIIATYKTYYKTINSFQSKEDKYRIMVNIILTFAIWTFNALACLEWALIRTDLFIDLDSTKCIIIYISNYLFYMLSKLCLHLLLLYRLYLAFHGTVLSVNHIFLRLFAVIISIDFIVFVSLWLDICLEKVSVGIVLPSESLRFCTLYNNSSASQMTLYEKIWPTMFGAQDFIVGILTLSIFIYKLNQLSRISHDIMLEALVRKLFIMGTSSIVSTFILFTFAVPFYSNLTFLLPLDALINSLCVLLLLDWTNSVYLKLCCAMDSCLLSVFEHESSESDEFSRVLPKMVIHKLDVPFKIHVPSNSIPIGTNETNTSHSPKLKYTVYTTPLSHHSHSIGELFTTHESYKKTNSDVRKHTKTGSDGQTFDKSQNALPFAESRFVKSCFF